MDDAKIMDDSGGGTRAAILASARSAFLVDGFSGVSMRAIATSAGVTTGAIYGYFPSKEALFDAVVGPAGDGLFALHLAALREFSARPAGGRSFDAMWEFELEKRSQMMDFIYDHLDDFRIISEGSTGTRWERYLDKFVEVEVSSTFEYERDTLEVDGHPSDVERVLVEVLTGLFFKGVFDLLSRDLSRTEAQRFIAGYGRFFHDGMRMLMERTAAGT